jgi:predicted permease
LVAESAFTVVLLVGAALLAHSFFRLTHVNAGYTSERVLTARVQLPPRSKPERIGQLTDEALARFRATPGVVAAGAGNMMPLAAVTAISTFSIPGPSGDLVPTRSLTYLVTPGYAEALGLQLRAGRFFDRRDAAGGSRAMIVNDEFVRRYLPAGMVVGRRFVNLYQRGENGLVTEIVGVVGTTLKGGNDREPEPEIYFVDGDRGRRIEGAVNFVVRTSGPPAALSSVVRQALRNSDGGAIIARVEPLADPLWASVAQPRFATSVLGSFALVALILASVGLYGVLSYSVSQRRRELGVRAALGASRGSLIGLVLREGLTVSGAGAVLGLLAAAGAARVVQHALFGITPLDPLSFVVAPLILAPIAMAACVLPAIRAAAVSPAAALRGE